MPPLQPRLKRARAVTRIEICALAPPGAKRCPCHAPYANGFSLVPVDGSTVESWDRGVHRGVLANVVITKYAVIIGPNVSFVNVAMTTTDQKVRGTNYQ